MKEADLRGLDTSSVTNMNSMFSKCTSLTSLDLSNFDTLSITSMNYLFDSCGTATVPLAVTYGSGWTLGTSKTLLGATNLKFINSLGPDVGKVVMSDGTFIKAENYSSYTGTATPVGIVCHVNDDETTGYDTSFTAIIGTTIDGDTNGSDNWSKICTADPEGSLDPATNYPVFNYALNYAATANITNTDYADGWYVPSVYELYNYVYPNKLT